MLFGAIMHVHVLLIRPMYRYMFNVRRVYVICHVCVFNMCLFAWDRYHAERTCKLYALLRVMSIGQNLISHTTIVHITAGIDRSAISTNI